MTYDIPEEAVLRVRQMEACFDRLQKAFRENSGAFRDPLFQKDLNTLKDYYEDGLWLRDYTLDEQHRFPGELKRGVLSQDAVYLFLDQVEQAALEARRHTNRQLTRWIGDAAARQYPEDISLVCLYGSSINGTDNPWSDVDCYFVPETERAYGFARTFLLDGVGYDIFPMPWPRLEAIASLEAGMQPLVGDVQILYCRSQQDMDRFRQLQETLRQSLASRERLEAAAQRCRYTGKLLASASGGTGKEIRKAVSRSLMVLGEAAAIFCGTYNHKGLKKQPEDLRALFADRDPAVFEAYRAAAEAPTPALAMEQARRMLDLVCGHLGIEAVFSPDPSEPKPEPGPLNGAVLADIYQEIRSTFLKIYRCCRNRDAVSAFLNAGVLQHDLDDSAAYGCPDYDLLTDYQPSQLPLLAETARRIEEDLVRQILLGGGTVTAYADFAGFEAASV